MPDSVARVSKISVSECEAVELTVSEETRKHQLGTVAHSVDSTVLDNQSLVRDQESLKRGDDLAQVRLIAGVVHLPLRIQNIVQSDQLLRLIHRTTSHTTQLLHVRADAQQQTQVHAQCSDVGTSLAADPEDAEVSVVVELDELALVDGSDTEHTLDGGDQGRALEERTGEGLERTRELRPAAGQLIVQADHGDVLFSGTLLRLDEASGAVDADDEAACDLGIEGTAVSGLLDTVATG